MGFAHGKVTNMLNAVQWKNDKIEILQKNDETEVRPSGEGWGATRAYINADGSTIVSDAAYNNVTNKTMVVQWKNGEIDELPSLNNIENTWVCGISAEGSIVVGLAIDSITRKFKAVQWKNGKIKELPSLKDFDEAKVCSISADGSTIVGYSGCKIKSMATLWTKNDVFSVQSLLEESGVTLEENHLAVADLVSANGLLVMGRCDHLWSNCYFKAILPSQYLQ